MPTESELLDELNAAIDMMASVASFGGDAADTGLYKEARAQFRRVRRILDARL